VTKILALCIDAANADLLDAWSDALPTLSALRARGTWHRMIGLEDFFVGSTWPSLYTGLAPASHGHHALVQLVPGRYEYRRMADGELVQGRPFWESLAAAGHPVAVLDVPLTRLSPELRGVQTVEWGSHDALYGFRAHPPELRDEIERRHGLHPIGGSCDGLRQSAADWAAFFDDLERAVETKTRITLELLTRHPWDFAIQVFTEAHCAGHQAWHLHDAAHPAHDPEVVSELGDPLLRVYRRIDAALGAVLECAPPDATVLVLSAHGMSYWYGAQFLLRDVLVALGVTRPPAETPSQARWRRGGELADTLWTRLPEAVRAGLRPLVRRLREPRPPPPVPTLGVDVLRSACFPVVNGQPVGGIRVNLAGREPHGVVAPDELDAFCETLSSDLLALVDTRTGGPAVKRVVRCARDHSGRAAAALPDLLVHWSDEVPTGALGMGPEGSGRVVLQSPKIGEVAGTNAYRRTGEHRPDGFVLVAVPGAAAGGRGADVRLVDLAPTLAAAFGVSLPEADGRVVPGLLEGR
jgi:predicted AlkP superfamily phosphohydrolase/phosphomutase